MEIRAVLRDPRLYPLWVGLLAIAVLLPGIGRYGLWEPHEIRVADRANAIANAESDAEAGSRRASPQTRSELTPRLAAWGLRHLGGDERAARLPLVALAVVTVLAAFFIGFRTGGARAGLIAALMLLSFPAVLLHGRHLTSEIGTAAGHALAALGLVGLLGKKSFGFFRRAALHDAIDAALIAIGAYLAYRAAGALLGVMPVFAGFGLAALIALVADREGDAASGGRRALVAAFSLAVAAAAVSFFVIEVFDFTAAGENDRGILADLFGKTFVAESGYHDSLAGTWRPKGDGRVGLTTLLEQIAIGTFPWVGLVAIAMMARLAPGAAPTEAADEPARERRGEGLALVLWALAAYVAATVFARKVGGISFPAWAALAVAAGAWLDRELPRRDERREGLPLLAFFAIAAAVVVGRDLLAFAERLTSLNLPGLKLEFPAEIKIHVVWIGLGCAAALAVAIALALRGGGLQDPSGPTWRRAVARLRVAAVRGGPIGVAAAVAGALLFTQVLTPALSDKLSTKNILATYQELRGEGDLLGIMGGASGAAYYAGTDYEKLAGRNDLLRFLQRGERVFALAPRGELCPLNKLAREKGVTYHLLDESSADFRLFSNRLEPGETDHNPLLGVFLPERPANVGRPLSFNLDDQLELIGVAMPTSVQRGDTFEMKLYFKVLAPVRRNWKQVFVHFDRGVRFQGDHVPADGLCGTSQWVPGDIVVDRFEVTAGSRTHPAGPYKVWAGLYVGQAPSYTNMTVKSAGADDKHRIPLGTIKLR